jgi:hypothetical protein
MRVGLFVPCYVDAFHATVGIAPLALLECSGQLVGHGIGGS